MNFKYKIILVSLHILLVASVFPQEISELEIPLCPVSICGENPGDHEVHKYSGFSLCFRNSYKDAEWVSYTLTQEKLIKNARRTNKFTEDKNISTGSAKLSDYKASGYDRGHLAPAADMAWSGQSENESFLMSNITPQAPQFNRGIWKELEAQVRKYAKSLDFLIVATGPVLEKQPEEYSFIGQSKVRVPEYFYKVLLAKDKAGNWQSIGFIIPNEKSGYDIFSYKVCVNEVEERCGIDFFSALDDSIEEEVESQTENIFTKDYPVKPDNDNKDKGNNNDKNCNFQRLTI